MIEMQGPGYLVSMGTPQLRGPQIRAWPKRWRSIAVIVGITGQAACSGSVGGSDAQDGKGDGARGGAAGDRGQDGTGGNDPGMGGPALNVAPTALRRLTNKEYRNTLTALLSLPSAPKDALAPDPLSKAGFDNFGSDLFVSGSNAGQYADNVAELAKTFKAPTCQAKEEASCAKDFVASFGKRAFRRPLTAEEQQRYQALYTDERTRSDHAGSIGQVVETMLQSPKFLYRFELGLAKDGPKRNLTPYEIASELSYMFTASMPDDALFAAADANALQTPTQIEAQARRLLKLPAARGTLRDFVAGYSGISRFAELPKSAKVYPSFTPALHKAMEDETNRFIDGVLWEGDGTFKTLMTAPYSYINSTLAAFYGASDPGKGEMLVKTMLNPQQRAGLLTQASVLAAHSKTDESFPILRGKFVRVGLLCQALPPPPKVVPKAPEPRPTSTTRERFAQHSSDPACAGCHTLIDPLGFGLENYDGIGQYRDRENGKPVDASGVVTGTLDIDGPFRGAVEVAQKLSMSIEARQCFATQAYRWIFGRYISTDEETAVHGIESALAQGGLDIRELFVSITKSEAFAHRTFD